MGSLSGVGHAARLLLTETRMFFTQRMGIIQARRYRNATQLKLQLGCGFNNKPGWTNVDLHRKADVKLDLRQPLPLRDRSCALIYSEHFLEHIDYPEPVTSLVKECFRVLQPGGIFSVVVPDIVLVLRSYLEGGSEEYYAAQRLWHPSWCKTQMEHVNYNFRQAGEHRFCYDFETLRALLERGGFADVERREFDKELDTPDRRVGSLYVQCRKPA